LKNTLRTLPTNEAKNSVLRVGVLNWPRDS